MRKENFHHKSPSKDGSRNSATRHPRTNGTHHKRAHSPTAESPTPQRQSIPLPHTAPCPSADTLRTDRALLFLRLFVATILFTQAITKSQQYPWLAEEYPSILGLSGADVVSLVGIIDLVAAAMIGIGLFTRITAAVMAVVMFGAAFLMFPHQSFVLAEAKVVYAGIYIFLLLAGAGRFSLDRVICNLRSATL